MKNGQTDFTDGLGDLCGKWPGFVSNGVLQMFRAEKYWKTSSTYEAFLVVLHKSKLIHITSRNNKFG